MDLVPANVLTTLIDSIVFQVGGWGAGYPEREKGGRKKETKAGS